MPISKTASSSGRSRALITPQANTELPDFNSRGCQKGCDNSHRMYDPCRIKPTELVGGSFHLWPYFFQLNPGQNDRDTRVEVIKLAT